MNQLALHVHDWIPVSWDYGVAFEWQCTECSATCEADRPA